MATARKKHPKAEPIETNFAINAITEAHNAMRAKCAGLGVGSCFASDLEHDKTVLRSKRAWDDSNSFVWIVTPHATHMMRIGTGSDALVNVSKSSVEATTFGMFVRSVLECYDQTMIDSGFVRAYVYQSADFEGVLALANRSNDGPIDQPKLFSLIADQVRAMALDKLGAQLKIVNEDLAYAVQTGWIPSIEKQEAEKKNLAAQMDRVREWSAST